MTAPLSRISFLLAVIIFIAAWFQKPLAEKLGNPITGPTQMEQVFKGARNAVSSQPIIEIPTHPVQATIFWVALAIAALALWAWIVEDAFWIALIAMVIALAAAVLKLALLPAFIAAAKAGHTQVKRRRATTRTTAVGSAATTTTRRRKTSL